MQDAEGQGYIMLSLPRPAHPRAWWPSASQHAQVCCVSIPYDALTMVIVKEGALNLWIVFGSCAELTPKLRLVAPLDSPQQEF